MAGSIAVLSPTTHPAYYSPGVKRRYRIPETVMLSSSRIISESIGSYYPDEQRYSSTLAKKSEEDLPPSWPKKLTGPLAWKPIDFENQTGIICNISDREQEDIDTALREFKKLDLPPQDATSATFRLRTLSERLTRVQNCIYEGVGISVLRGLNADKYTDEEMATIFLGVSSYIAERRGMQDQRGSMINHVLSKYEGEWNDDKNQREMPFHTDVVCDTLALMARNCASVGGRSTFASSWTVINELAQERPDLISVLAKPNWPHDTFGRQPPYHNRALLYFNTDGQAILSASRRLLLGSPETPRSKGIPGLNNRQVEALDAIHFIAKRNSLKVPIKKGDMCFINNMAIMHAREAFDDSQSAQRHLLRLWLNNQDRCWKLPQSLELAWARVFDDEDRDAVWDLEPVKRNGRLYNPAASCD